LSGGRGIRPKVDRDEVEVNVGDGEEKKVREEEKARKYMDRM
jgi:hypothetical protein